MLLNYQNLIKIFKKCNPLNLVKNYNYKIIKSHLKANKTIIFKIKNGMDLNEYISN